MLVGRQEFHAGERNVRLGHFCHSSQGALVDFRDNSDRAAGFHYGNLSVYTVVGCRLICPRERCCVYVRIRLIVLAPGQCFLLARADSRRS